MNARSGGTSRLVSLAIVVFAASVATSCSTDPYAKMVKHATRADQYAATGKLAEAIIEYRNAIQAEPRASEIRVKLAEVYFRHGEPGKALDEYVRAADVSSNLQLQLKAGSLLLGSRRFDDAKVRAQKALTIDPKNSAAQILLANALAGLKDLDGAVAELHQAIEWDPDQSQTYASLGAIELSRGNQRAAEQAFKRAVELAPQSAAAHLALAGFHWSSSQWTDAERELTEALRVEPDNALAHRVAATFYVVTNRRDLAEPHFQRNYELTKSPEAAVALADYYVSQKKEAAARNVLEPLTKNPKTAALVSTRLAILDKVAGLPEDARTRLESVLSADPTQLAALILKSGFLLSDGKADEALQIAKAAAEAHPDAAGAFSALGRAQAARKDTAAAVTAYQQAVRLNPLAIDAKLALARLELAAGRATSSASLADDAVKTHPQSAAARLLLVRALIARGDTDRAKTELDVLAAGTPDSAEVHTQRGMLYGRTNRPADARREFERAVQLQPGALDAIGGLVALDLSTGHLEAARARADALAQGDAVPPSLMLAARTYAKLGDLPTSEKVLRRVLSADPSYLSAYAMLGQIYAKQGRLDEALTEFETLARKDPKPVAALTMIGMLQEAQGKVDAARSRYEQVIQLDASAPVAANNLAWLYAVSGTKLDTALDLAQAARGRLPNTPEVSDTLGFVYYRKAQYPQAIEALRAAIEKDDKNPIYQYHLGLALAASGEKSDATQHLERALALKPDFDGSADAKERLKTLRTP